ncbi:MAG: DUF2628 domain-containing protein [Synergistaceae bacterium]|nr:DUF2628 domain-containing protein [Synergistaceae bacterium]
MADLRSVLEEELRSGNVRQLLAAHLQTPEKVSIYGAALDKCLVNGRVVFAATWSWWAWIGGAFYFFYRKMYTPGLVLLGVSLLLIVVPIPFVGLITWIISAVTAKYFYCKKFQQDLEISGYPDKPRDDVLRNLNRLGGYNTWAVVLGVIVNFILFLPLLALISLVLSIR